MFIQLKPEYGKNYKAGQIYFTYQINSPISQGISWFSYKDMPIAPIERVSHCGLCIGEGQGISAQPHGIDYEDLNEIFNDPYRRIIFREPLLLDIMGADNIAAEAKKYIGKKYDFCGVFGFTIVNSWLGRKVLNERWRKEILRFFNALNRFWCSEFIMKLLHDCLFTNDKDFNVTPKEVFYHKCMKEWKRD